MEKHYSDFTLRHIPRSENMEADELAKAASQNAPMPPDVFFQVLTIKAVKQEEEHPVELHAITSEDWRSPIFAYLNETNKPMSKHEIERINARTKHYSIIGGELYQSGVTSLLLKCISKQQGEELLSEIHVGSCDTHRGPY